MVKILSQAGISLADVYDIEGSIAGIDQLESREVSLVHEMGATLFSERLTMNIRRSTSGSINQSTTFDVTIANLPAGIWRIVAVQLLANVAARVAQAQVSLRDPRDGREIPLAIWDANNDVEAVIRMVENGAGVTNLFALQSLSPPTMPSLGLGAGQPQARDNELVLRGATAAFGAGTVQVLALYHILFSQVEGLSSLGLPVPAW